MSRMVGTVSMGIRAPIIRSGDDLVEIVTNSVLETVKDGALTIRAVSYTHLYCCEAALALRERRPGVTVEAVIPCEEQAARWRERDRERWFSLVERCDNETMLQHHYDRGCMLRRNRYLVDHSAMLIAVYDGMLGGTMYTISYAMKRGLDVVTLDIP